ncbi:MMPL family transporter [Rubrobacter tropicus]|uniref:MMPL family transporter n=1 Tax=Rubrobacter tropicus TaxID=2653851 RepID=A0A6G8Q4Q7_9ACTN|nr:efflux RND transporter permease subunit [Rubrobacter tropicus]QIN81409.1 MMPL family transporter [Rubrobacter tropicus]
MQAIVRWCLKNKSVVFLAAVILVAAGSYATTRLNQELLPDIEFPLITVSTPVPGAGPDLVDEQVTQPLQDSVEGIEGIESVQATSSPGFSVLVVEFGLDVDTEQAEDEINDAINGVSLPEQAVAPEVNRQSASQFPILNVSLSAKDGDLARVTEYAEDEAIPLIEDVEGVASADLVGGSERQIEVDLKPAELEERGIPAEAIIGAIQGSNVNAPVGDVSVEGLATPVRTTSELSTVEDLRDLPVGAAGAPAAPTGAPSGAPTGAPAGASAPPSGASAPAAASAAASAAPTAEAPEPVLLSDVAEVSESSSDISGISRTNGEPSLGLNVVKEPEANTVEVAEGVTRALGQVREDLGEDEVIVVFNSAEDVEESVNGLVEKALIGGLLAVGIIFLFLRSLRATLVTAVSLPTSILAALLFSWADNLTLNIITLAGLTIAVGRVVDDAIVVLENSYRYVQEGYSPEEAALKGTTEVASAITSSTLTTTAVFLPLGLVGGIVSKFFLPLSLTVAFALIASLIVSITVIPVLTSVFIKRQAKRGAIPEARTEQDDREIDPEDYDDGYLDYESRRSRRTNGRGPGALRLLVFSSLVIGALFAGAVVAAGAGLLNGLSFVPDGLVDGLGGIADGVRNVVGGIDTGSPVFLVVAGAVAALVVVGLALLAARAARRSARRGEDSDGLLVNLYAPLLLWSLRHRLAVLLLALLAFVGGLAAIPFLAVSFFPPSEERLLQATVELPAGTAIGETSDELRPFEDFMNEDRGVESYQLSIGGEDNFNPDSPLRTGNQAQAFVVVGENANVQRTLSRLADEGRDLYGEGFQVQVLQQGPPTGGIEVTITGGSEDELRQASETVVDEIEKNDDITNVQSDLSEVSPEIEVSVNAADAAEAGLSPGAVSTSLGTLLGGTGSQVTLGDEPVAIGLPEGSVDSIEEVRGLPLGSGQTVGDVAEVREVQAPSAISRDDGDRAVTVTGTITSEDTSSVSNEVNAALPTLDLPDGVTASVGGESEDIEESFRNLLLSILVALVLVYLILVVFFGSLVTPLIILLAVPLTTAGAFGALLITGTALSLPALLGVLLLIGIVVSNAILLVDFAQNARDHHDTVDAAIFEAGRARLRPILMTALATIFALIPLAFGFGGGGSALISSSLAIPVIGGLITSTFLTLLVVPVGYSLVRGGLRRKKG